MTSHYGEETSELSIRGEQALWRAVITQALMDASSQSKKIEQKYEKSQALCWLLNNGQDFYTVCEHAGFDPRHVREQSIKALERNCQWRAPAKSKKKPKNKDISNSTQQKENSSCL